MDSKTIKSRFSSLHNVKQFLELLYEMKVEEIGERAKPFSLEDMLWLMQPWYSKRYKIFRVAKKSGGTRQISAPFSRLKSYLTYIKQFLEAYYHPQPCVQGFAQGRSVAGNAGIHLHQNYVYNIDLSDFFPSITYGRVYKRLQHPPYNFPEPICRIIASLGCVAYTKEDGTQYNGLPQGAPTSPILSNMVCEQMDRRLTGLAKRFGLHYSRYADDMTFSSMHNVYQENSDFIKELKRIVGEQGFKFNEKKTRLQKNGSRQEVTGLKVGDKVNVSREYIKELRSTLHVWEKYGYTEAYAWFYSRYKNSKGYGKRGEPVMEQVVEGKLNYLKMVKGGVDSTYKRLRDRFDYLMGLLNEERPKGRGRFVVVTYSITKFMKLFSGVKMEFKTTGTGYVSGKMIIGNVVTPIYFDKIFRESVPKEKEKIIGAIQEGTSEWWISEIEDKDKKKHHRYNHFWQISKYKPVVTTKSYIEKLLTIWEKEGLEAAVREWKKTTYDIQERGQTTNKPSKGLIAEKTVKKESEASQEKDEEAFDGIRAEDFENVRSEIEALKREIKKEKSGTDQETGYDFRWDDIPFLESGEPIEI